MPQKKTPPPLFRVYANIWFEKHKKAINPASWYGYEKTLGMLLPTFGEMRIDKIRTADVTAFLEGMASTYSSSYVKKMRAMLYQIFTSADADGLIKVHPVERAPIIKQTTTPENEERRRPFTKLEQKILELKLPHTLLGISTRFMIETGIQGQELLALSADDISKNGDTIHIHRMARPINGRMCPEELPEDCQRTIHANHKVRQLALTLKEMAGPTTIMGAETHNAYFDAKDFRRSFENMLSKIPGVEPRTPVACRNTFVANQFAAGKKATEIAQMLGIKDTRGIAKFRPKRRWKKATLKKSHAKPTKED